jgi:NADH/NAD ratio-sensing transcriptional regulator Rex
MKEGDSVRLKDNHDITAVVVTYPRAIGRKNRRIKVRDQDNVERWIAEEDLEPHVENR